MRFVSVQGSRLGLAVLWLIAAVAILVVTEVQGVGATDRDGRVPMGGRAVVRLAEGDYGLWYEVPYAVDGNRSFSAPDGVSLRAEAQEDGPSPEVDLGGVGSEVRTPGRTRETIGTLRVGVAGRYRLIASGGPRGAAITIGDTGGAPLARAARRVVIFTGIGAVLWLLFAMSGRFRRAREAPPLFFEPEPAAPVALPAGAGVRHSAQDVLDHGLPGRATITSANPMAMTAPDGTPVYFVAMQVEREGMPIRAVISGQRVPPGAETRLVPGAELPVKIDAADPDLVAIDWAAP